MAKNKKPNRKKNSHGKPSPNKTRPSGSLEKTESFINSGIQHLQEGALGYAADQFRKVLAITPENAHVHSLLGVTELSAGNPSQAVVHFNQAIAIDNTPPDFHFNLALASLETGASEHAIAALNQATSLRPSYTEAWNTLGTIYMARLKWKEARQALEKATVSNPSYGEAWVNLCGVYQELGLHHQAIEAGSKGIEYCPEQPHSYYNLARAMDGDEQWDEAISYYQECVALDPTFISGFVNYSRCLTKTHQVTAALEIAQSAVSLDPYNAEANNNLALAIFNVGNYSQALLYHHKTISLESNNVEYHSNLARTLLMLEDFSSGWHEYEYGLLTGYRGPLNASPVPMWEGQPLAGRKIHVIGEQGIGEQIMFATLLNDLLNDGATVVYECEKRLAPIFARSMENITVAALSDPPDPAVIAPDIDYRIAIGSLGRFYRHSVDDFQPTNSFLKPDPVLTARYKRTYDGLGKGLKVGISWKSASPHHAAIKNIPIELWEPILKHPNCHFISLQYGDVADDCAWVRDRLGVDIFVDPDVSALNSLEQSMAQTCAMDLVLSISNATIHLAAACGVESWMMLGKVPLWHWFSERDDTLWYDTVKVFRQKEAGQWDDVIDMITRSLAQSAAAL